MTISAPSRGPSVPTIDPDAIRRRELSAFLRSRRERLTPAHVGLPAGGRRRTPGLRREEVAQLAGVGITWYTWLEQGRDIRVSESVLEAISRTLQLDRDERLHLFTLAGAADHTVVTDPPEVPASVQAMLDKLAPFPACIQDAKYQLLAYNRVYGRMIVDIDVIPPADRNCMLLLFTDPRWRKALPDWDNAAARMVAQFRGQMAEHVAEPPWKALLRRLRESSPEFAELWARHEVAAVANKCKRIRNPHVGLLKFEVTNMWLNPRPGIRLLTYSPNDAETARRLDRLATLIDAAAVA